MIPLLFLVLLLSHHISSWTDTQTSVQTRSTSNCQSESNNCIGGVCSNKVDPNCGDAPKTTDNNTPLEGNGTTNASVIKCDEAGLFSTYAICAPGKCCSNIPFGITGSILFLTIAIGALTFVVVRQSCGSTPTPDEPAQEKLCDPAAKEES
ncbi:hypothetical protein PRIPAC_84238 [Pristionchus pacificus]|uniref:Uncharacterized protein n=1 Tax=Pristionchus pacificus TaxID=54126 RepID=A0A2A6BLU6_PRIPA|nr:hypothetical protein PRIPAC_84238 [Pristionchus pacificus]|eukprot:PDM66885.1 hypothetical protein PRIPAC_48302 [Pristionchus pacificus]